MEIFDLLDDIENQMLQGKSNFLINKREVIVNKQDILDLLDQVRKVINTRYKILKNKLTEEDTLQANMHEEPILSRSSNDLNRHDPEDRSIISEARKEAIEIKNEMDDYADKVLENLKLTVTKMKKNLFKMDTVLEQSRERLKKTAYYAHPEEENDNESTN